MVLLNNCISDSIQQLQSVNNSLETINHIVTVSNDTISNQIAAVNTLLVVFSIILALIGAGLGFYITKLHNKVLRIKSSIDEKEQTIIALAKTVEETDRKIQSDLSGLYKQLQKEESLSLLCRLEEEPLDITNLSQLLLARELEEDGFIVLKKAFLKLSELDNKKNIYYDEKRKYCLLFFQHYLYNTVLDNDLRDDVVSCFKHCINCAFKRDIIKSTNDLCKAISTNGAPFDKVKILVSYLKALNNTEFDDLVELKNIFQENLNKDLLVDAIDKCRINKEYLNLFGVKPPIDSENEDDNNDYSEDD